MKRPSLKRALKLAQSVAGLARAVHVSPSTVRRWATKLTDSATDKLSRYLERQQELVERRKVDLKRIYELMNLAGEIGKLPTGKSGSKPRIGKLTVGVQHVKKFGVMLSLDVIDDIDVWLHSIKKRFPLWQLLAICSQYGLGEHRGYKTVYHQLAPDAGDFAISSNVATPRMGSLNDAMSHLRQNLEAMVENGKVLVFLHTVTAFNYHLRTDDERASKQTQLRREREKEREWRRKKELAKQVPSSTERTTAQGWGLHSKAIAEYWEKQLTKAPSSVSSPSSKTKARATKPKRVRRSAPKGSKASTKKFAKSSKRSASLKAKSRVKATKKLLKKVTKRSSKQSVKKVPARARKISSRNSSTSRVKKKTAKKGSKR